MSIQARIDIIEETELGHVVEQLNVLLSQLQAQASAGNYQAKLDSFYLIGYLETPAALLLDLLYDEQESETNGLHPARTRTLFGEELERAA